MVSENDLKVDLMKVSEVVSVSASTRPAERTRESIVVRVSVKDLTSILADVRVSESVMVSVRARAVVLGIESLVVIVSVNDVVVTEGAIATIIPHQLFPAP